MQDPLTPLPGWDHAPCSWAATKTGGSAPMGHVPRVRRPKHAYSIHHGMSACIFHDMCCMTAALKDTSLQATARQHRHETYRRRARWRVVRGHPQREFTTQRRSGKEGLLRGQRWELGDGCGKGDVSGGISGKSDLRDGTLRLDNQVAYTTMRGIIRARKARLCDVLRDGLTKGQRQRSVWAHDSIQLACMICLPMSPTI